MHTKVSALLRRRLLAEDGGHAFDLVSSYLSDRAHSGFEARGEGSSSYLPVEFRKELLRELRTAVIEREAASANYRVLAWVWYGHLSPSLSDREAFLLVYNNSFVGSIGGLDGFSSLAVRVADIKFGRDEYYGVSKEIARTCLARFGAASAAIFPLNVSEVPRRLTDSFVPVEFWKRTVEANDELAVGIGIVSAALLHSGRSRVSRSHRRTGGLQQDVTAWAKTWLKRPAVQKHQAARDLQAILLTNEFVASSPSAPESTELAKP